MSAKPLEQGAKRLAFYQGTTTSSRNYRRSTNRYERRTVKRAIKEAMPWLTRS
jgi:hypothetical protein